MHGFGGLLRIKKARPEKDLAWGVLLLTGKVILRRRPVPCNRGAGA